MSFVNKAIVGSKKKEERKIPGGWSACCYDRLPAAIRKVFYYTQK